jgi:hypothetical protein
MKRKLLGIVALQAALLTLGFALSSCGSSPKSSGSSSAQGSYLASSVPQTAPERKTSSRVPDFIRQAMQKVEAGYLIGIGTAPLAKDMSNLATAKDQAEARGKASISGQLREVVSRMIEDHRASSEADPSAVSSFQETTITTLTYSTLKGAQIVDFNDENGILWMIVKMSKEDGANEINQAASAAKLKAPKAAAMDAIDRMNKAIEADSKKQLDAYNEEIPVVDR